MIYWVFERQDCEGDYFREAFTDKSKAICYANSFKGYGDESDTEEDDDIIMHRYKKRGSNGYSMIYVLESKLNKTK